MRSNRVSCEISSNLHVEHMYALTCTSRDHVKELYNQVSNLHVRVLDLKEKSTSTARYE